MSTTLRREVCEDVRKQFFRELAVALVSAVALFATAVGVVWLVQMILGAASQGG